MFYRLLDRTQTVERAHAMLLWRGRVPWRIFREGDVSFLPQGYLRPRRITRVPPVMGLVAAGQATDVPARVVVEARRGLDWLRCTVQNRSLAQVLVPNETDFGATAINEVCGSYRLEGLVKGQTVDSAGHSFYEHVGDA